MLDTLSPQRRRLVVLVAALGLAIAAFAAVVARGDRSGADQSRPGPVILVPGYGGRLSSLDDIADRLRRAGRSVQELPLPDGGVGDLHGQADALDAAVQRDLSRGAPSVDLVGYSAGGVVVRLWVSEGDHAGLVRRVVTIGTPSGELTGVVPQRFTLPDLDAHVKVTLTAPDQTTCARGRRKTTDM